MRPDRLALAARLGAGHTVDVSALAGMTAGAYDAVLDATSDPTAPASALS